ncbi:MraY family glycosyltransferase [Bacteroides congonensis]|jgi:UDP-GlcNAc:undecaprenyl-phosphate GlcNAc-1-phosphate transferase
MMYIYIVGIFILSVLLAVIVIPRIIFISYKKRLFDVPDVRKVHKTPTPRLGGLAFVPVIMISVCIITGIRYYMNNPVDSLWSSSLFIQYLFLVAGMTLLYLIGVADDLVGVGYRYKFIVQILSASFLPLSGLWINDLGGLLGFHAIPAFIGMPLTVFLVVYITNAINLIDGIDGLASGLTCIALVLLIIVCALTGQWTHALLASATLGVVSTFYYYNVFSASDRKLFMGDAGSLTLGYILSFLVLHFWMQESYWDPFELNLNMVTISALLIPLLDVIRVFVSRVRDGRNPFLPDKNHIHHKLLRTGMRVRAVMISLLLLSVFLISTNFILSFYINTTFMLLFDLGFWCAVHLVINRGIAKHEKLTGKKWYKTYLHIS